MAAGARARSGEVPQSNSVPDLGKLRTATAVRERCGMVCRWVVDERSPHFILDQDRLGAVADYVADVTRAAAKSLFVRVSQSLEGVKEGAP